MPMQPLTRLTARFQRGLSCCRPVIVLERRNCAARKSSLSSPEADVTTRTSIYDFRSSSGVSARIFSTSWMGSGCDTSMYSKWGNPPSRKVLPQSMPGNSSQNCA